MEDICIVCNKPIIYKYYVDSWGNKTHTFHLDLKQVFRCDSCGKFVCQSTGFNEVEIGRVLCNTCFRSVNNIENKLGKLFSFVTKKIADIGIKPLNVIENDIYIVPSNVLSNSNKDKFRGRANSSKKCYSSWIKYNHKIEILSFLPQVEFESVLAHELTHTWLYEFEHSLSHKQEEGFCNLASEHLLNQWKGKHTEILKNNIATNLDPVYGDGFREMKKILLQIGWKKLINSIKTNQL